MNKGIVAVRYAKALLDFARDKHLQEPVYRAMKELGCAYTQVPKLRKVVEDRMIDPKKRTDALLQASQSDKQTSTCLIPFFNLVLHHGREDLLQSVALQYMELYRKEHHIVYGVLTTALPVDEAVADKVKQLLGTSSSDRVELELRNDPALLGGFVLESQMQVLDLSVATQLRKIKKLI